MAKTNYRKVISSILTIIILLIMGVYLYQNRSLFNNLTKLAPWIIILVGVLHPMYISVIALTNKLIIDNLGKTITFWDAFMLQFVNYLLNRFIAESGAVYRGAYLKTQHDFPVSKYLSSIGGSYIIGMMTNAIVGIILSIIIFYQQNTFNLIVFLFLLVIFVVTTLFMFVKSNLKPKNWLFKRLNQVIAGWLEIKSNPKLVLRIILLNILSTIVNSISIYLIYRGLDAKIKLLNSFYYFSISFFTTLVNITPGGLGINEALLMFSSNVIGIPDEIVFLGSIIYRAITLISSSIFGGISHLILNNKLKLIKSN